MFLRRNGYYSWGGVAEEKYEQYNKKTNSALWEREK